MKPLAIAPGRLAAELLVYFAVILAAIIALSQIRPDAIQYLPIGGTDAIDQGTSDKLIQLLGEGSEEVTSSKSKPGAQGIGIEDVGRLSLFVFGHLAGTVILMLPVARTYRAINYQTGFRKTFVRTLIVLPICATTIVLLIQDSLPLAFGLAALVAAVRFRVTLDEAMDGIFIFAAICVGLAAGIGYLGVAYIMCVFFCFGNLLLWQIDYGRNPLDDLRQQKKRKKMAGTASGSRVSGQSEDGAS